MGKNRFGGVVERDVVNSGEKHQKHRFYGRRKGHKLRPGRKILIEKLLPDVIIPLCSDRKPLNPAFLFNPPVKKIWMEIGFGAGEHLAYHAQTNPSVGFLGIEPFMNGVANLLKTIDQEELKNIRLLNDDVWLLIRNLAENSLDRVFLLFPDPWPKKRHNRRRLFSNALLDQLSHKMLPQGELRFASDNICYVRHALEVIVKRKDFIWSPRDSDDWKKPPADTIKTRYEAKAEIAGDPIVYLTFRKV